MDRPTYGMRGLATRLEQKSEKQARPIGVGSG